MANGLVPNDIQEYIDTIIPRVECELANSIGLDPVTVSELYNLYVDLLRITAPWNFISFNKYLEIDEDATNPNRKFYHHRRDHLAEVFTALNDMEVYDMYDLVLISTPPRVGKEQPLYSKILTPTGWTTMGDVKIGTKIVGSDGKPYNVTGVFPQGEKDIYLVTFDDGTTVECGAEHLWTVQTRDDRKNGKNRTVRTIDMLKNLYVEHGTRKNYSINYVSPIEFTNTLDNDDIKPYLLGALLGDGSFVDSCVKFTNVDSDIISRVGYELPYGDRFGSKQLITHSIVKVDNTVRTSKGYGIPSKTMSKIREYGLFETKSDTKFIPKKYLYSTYNDRLELLKGLMDTDGTVVKGGSYCEYSTSSKQLAEDFIELVRSLGARATMVKKETKCKPSYRISFNITINPFYCVRKYDKFVPRETRKNKYISNIEKLGKTQQQCIMVDSPDHLYITDGYNLTHNTTSGVRFLAWIIGKYPESTQLATSYSDAITTSFYIGVMEIVMSQRYKEIFPESLLVGQNAKREEIWLKVAKRYPSITFVPIGGSMTGRAEASNYLYCDDLVSGIEEAMSIVRLENLWQKYTVNAKQRKKNNAKEIHIATRWSVNDPITKLAMENEDNPRCKIIKLPCYNELGESAFDFFGGFETKYYDELARTMDEASFSALYLQEPIEREGLLYHKEDLAYFFDLPNERPDSIVSVCDSKNLGTDYVACPIAYVYGETVYIPDLVYDPSLPEITRELVASALVRNNVVRADIEMNNGGNYYAEDLDSLIKAKGGKTALRLFYTSTNKKVKIITYSDFVKKRFVFKHPSTYASNSQYAHFMRDVLRWTQSGKNKHDDAPDSLAMLAQLIQDLEGNTIKVIDRRKLGL